MKKPTYRTWAEIDLDKIAANMRTIKNFVGEKTKVMAVVKADAYGHGYLNVSKVMLENGADYLGVAFIDEAEQLRGHGITAPILILGYTSRHDMQRLVEHNVMPTIYQTEDAEYLSILAMEAKKSVKVHIKLDTGMNRLGFVGTDPQAVAEILKISRLPGIEIEGIFTHFSKADETDDSYSEMQFERFCKVCEKLEHTGLHIPVKHVCNSAGLIKYKSMHLDMVRPGIISYGLYPSEEVDKNILKLTPAMSIKTVVTRIQYISKGEKISYGGIFTAPRRMKIATIPIGYADGYLRVLSNHARVIAGGGYAPVVGRICMDQCMIDVTDVNTMDVEDEVTVIGKEGENEVTVDDLAKLTGSINYELLCLIGKRVPRVYMKNGKLIDVLSYLV